MSEYGYDDRGYDDRGSRSHRSHRTREREPAYVNETTYIERGSGNPPRDLVFRPRDDSVEDIRRDFDPPGSGRRGPRSSRYDDDYYSDYDRRDRAPRSRRDDGYYSDERPRRERRKSVGDQLKDAAEGFGLGGVVAALSGGKERSRSRDRHRDRGDRHDRRRGDYSQSPPRSRSRTRGKWEQAAKAAVVAGAAEAFRSRKTPGPWTGEKGQRIATAALGAAGIDGFLDRNPDKKDKRHIVESAIGGLLANRVANGSRSRSRARGRGDSRSPSSSPRGGRSRSRSIFGRSRSRGRDGSGSRGNAIRNLAGAGAVAAAGKAIYDRVRSKSRSRKTRSRSRSVSSEDSYVPSRGRRYDKQSDSGNNNNERSLTGPAAGAGALATTTDTNRKRDSSSSSASSTDIENQRKKTRTKEILTAGFATIATIHAAHGVYNSMVASEKRRKLVSEGEMKPEEARKLKSKNMLQDAAAVGIAALGIKGAFGEWKEMNEQRREVHELAEKKRKKRKAAEQRRKEQQNNQYNYPVAYPAPVQQSMQPYPAYNDPTSYPPGGVPPPPIGTGGRYGSNPPY